MPQVVLRVNGQRLEVEVPSGMPLLWVLRDKLGLTGAKYGCGRGFCGACMIHVDGRPTPSCLLPASAVGNAEITTIEGLAGAKLHPVQQAWIDEDVPQCGYCQAGQLMSAAALLAANPDPVDDDIDAAMRGTICRCGTYVRIRRAIHRAAAVAREAG